MDRKYSDEELVRFMESYEREVEKRKEWSKKWREKNKEKMREMGKRYREKRKGMLDECKRRGLVK